MFEQGVIRPPSEANSLLIRVTRNCPWNRCSFCPAYKGKKFSIRSMEEILKDIDEMAETFSSRRESFSSAFLQDADSLILPTDELLRIIAYLREKFPALDRITTYARAKSLKRKSEDDYRRLREAGLKRIHTGMESGSAAVLKLMQKGATPDDILKGGVLAARSGISLSVYIMPGIGGKRLSREHALETAKLLNQIRPDFIRVRTFAIHPLSPIQKMAADGTFVPLNDVEIVAEIRLLLENLDEMPSHFRCGDFSLNLLMHVDGSLDDRKETMIRELDRFLQMPKIRQQAYSLLQRSYPAMIPMEALEDKELMKKLEQSIQRLEGQEEDGFNEYIRRLMTRQLPPLQTDRWP